MPHLGRFSIIAHSNITTNKKILKCKPKNKDIIIFIYKIITKVFLIFTFLNC